MQINENKKTLTKFSSKLRHFMSQCPLYRFARGWREAMDRRVVGERPRTDELLSNASDVRSRSVQRLPVPHEAGGQPRVLQLRYKKAR